MSGFQLKEKIEYELTDVMGHVIETNDWIAIKLDRDDAIITVQYDCVSKGVMFLQSDEVFRNLAIYLDAIDSITLVEKG